MGLIYLGSSDKGNSTHSQMVGLLSRHYGDGAVYLPRNSSTALLDAARAAGFVNSDGYLTREGRQLLAACGAA